VSIFTLGTSLQMIDRTYGHLAQDVENQDRELPNAYDAATRSAVGTLWARSSRKTRRCER
jgi:hypothetical protein